MNSLKITFLNEPFVWTHPNGFKYFYQTLIILFNINLFFAHISMISIITI